MRQGTRLPFHKTVKACGKGGYLLRMLAHEGCLGWRIAKDYNREDSAGALFLKPDEDGTWPERIAFPDTSAVVLLVLDGIWLPMEQVEAYAAQAGAQGFSQVRWRFPNRDERVFTRGG